MYVSYVVKFVYYYLRIILDKEGRVARFIQPQHDKGNRELSWEGDSDKEDTEKDKARTTLAPAPNADYTGSRRQI